VTTRDILSRLVAEARQDMNRRSALVSQDQLEQRIRDYTPKDFLGALRGPGLAVIAEMKQRTPSQGLLSGDYRPFELARAYEEGGAAAISVLTHMAGFGGRPEHVQDARQASSLPILRKDFITDPYEVGEARASGADAVLLIVAALQADELRRLIAVSKSRGLAALVEVHDAEQARVAVDAGAELIGVNHRDLRTFTIDLGLTERLRPLIPKDVLLVSESGIHSAADARRVREAGADAVLVGESLMRAADPAALIAELRSAAA